MKKTLIILLLLLVGSSLAQTSASFIQSRFLGMPVATECERCTPHEDGILEYRLTDNKISEDNTTVSFVVQMRVRGGNPATKTNTRIAFASARLAYNQDAFKEEVVSTQACVYTIAEEFENKDYAYTFIDTTIDTFTLTAFSAITDASTPTVTVASNNLVQLENEFKDFATIECEIADSSLEAGIAISGTDISSNMINVYADLNETDGISHRTIFPLVANSLRAWRLDGGIYAEDYTLFSNGLGVWVSFSDSISTALTMSDFMLSNNMITISSVNHSAGSDRAEITFSGVPPSGTILNIAADTTNSVLMGNGFVAMLEHNTNAPQVESVMEVSRSADDATWEITFDKAIDTNTVNIDNLCLTENFGFCPDALFSDATIASVSIDDSRPTTIHVVIEEADDIEEKDISLVFKRNAVRGIDQNPVVEDQIGLRNMIELAPVVRLSDLVLADTGGTPIPLSPDPFDALHATYTASVGENVQAVRVTPTAPEGSITVNGSMVSGSVDVRLSGTGEDTEINIEVSAPHKTAMSYAVIVSRAESTNADLVTLTLADIDDNNIPLPNPTAGVALVEYTVEVSHTIGIVKVTPTLDHDQAMMTIGGNAATSGEATDVTLGAAGTETEITIVVTAQDGTTMKTYEVTVNRALGNDATLSSLAISEGMLDPSFDSGTTDYTVAVANNVETITVTPTANDPNAMNITVNGDDVASGAQSGEIALTEGGSNTITVVVTAQDGLIVETYTVVVSRAPSSDATLSSLLISEGMLDPSFDSGTTDYTVAVANSTTTITVTPTVNHSHATIAMKVNDMAFTTLSDPIALIEGGDTAIAVVVTAQDGVTITTYTVVVARAPSNDAILSGLSLTDADDTEVLLNENFRSDRIAYTAHVIDNVAVIKVMPVARHTHATIMVNSTMATSGEATDVTLEDAGMKTAIEIVVTAQDGVTSQTYMLTVNRARVPTPDDATLFNVILRDDNMRIISLNKPFVSDATTYTASVIYTLDTVEVIPTAGRLATITMDGNTVVNGGSTNVTLGNPGSDTEIEIIVTSQDATQMMTYTVTVSRAPSNDAILSALTISQGVLVPSFNSEVMEYMVSVDNNIAAITVTPVANDPYVMSITVNGDAVDSNTASDEIALTEGGITTIMIVVTAQDGSLETYTVIVSRAPSSDATLSNIALSEGELVPNFDSAEKNYTVSVENNVATMMVTPTATNNNATIMVNDIVVDSGMPSQAVSLTEGGSTTITVAVMAQDSITSQTYTVVVSRAPSSDATLSGLSLADAADNKTIYLNENFRSNTTTYTAHVIDTIATVKVTPLASNSNATITVAGDPANSGKATDVTLEGRGMQTEIEIVVTSQDGEMMQTYTLTVHRASLPEQNDSTLFHLLLRDDNMSVISLNKPFASDATTYTANVTYTVEGVEVIPTASGGLGAEITVNKKAAENGVITEVELRDRGTDTKIDIVVTSPDDSTMTTYTVIVSRALSNDATLSNLVISQGVLVPSFNSAVMEYMVSVENDVETITVIPTANEYDTSIMVNSDAVASGTTSNEIVLVEGGDTTITVKATAAYGNMESYIIVVSRAPSSDATLSSLIVSVGKLEPSPFNPTTTSYTISVENAIAMMAVNATATNENAAIMVNDEAVDSGTTSNEIALIEGGITTITIKVTAQDATTETYTVVVNRAPSSDAILSNLAISVGELVPGFNSTTTSYMVSVENNVATMTVTPTANHHYATIMVNDHTVDSGMPSQVIALAEGGDTTIAVVVTAQDGETVTTYTVVVSRAPSSDATLSGLSLADAADDKVIYLNENFRSNTTAYTAHVIDTIATVKVTPLASNSNATITVAGDPANSGEATEVTLEEPGMQTAIEIVVTSQDGEMTQTYTLTVHRASVPAPDDSTLFHLLLRDNNMSVISLNKPFASDATTYTASVAYTIEGVEVIPTASGGLGAEITVNNEPAVNGVITEVELGPRGTDKKIEIVVISPDDSTSMTYTVIVSRALSNDATLSNLVVSQGVLVPSFNSAVMEYMVSVENNVETITVTPTANDPDTISITVNGMIVDDATTSNEIALAEGGDTTITVKVTAAYGNMKSYIVVVSRAPSSDATLSSLIVSVGELEPSPFDPTTTSYTISVENAIATMAVNATATNENAAIMVNDEAVASGTTSNEIALTEGGTTTIKIEVTAQDGATTETYTVVVGRAPSSDAILSNLAISVGELMPAFSSTTTSYMASVENDVATMTITPTANHHYATIMVNGEAVASGTTSNEIALTEGGSTIITVVVTAQDGETATTYTVVVSRASSDDATLSGLLLTDVDNNTIYLNEDFRADTTAYTAHVIDTIAAVKVTPMSDAGVTITINGDAANKGEATEVTLDDAGTETEIEIVVTASDGETMRTYTLTVHRAGVPAPDDSTLFHLLLRDDHNMSVISLDKPFASDETTYMADVAYTIERVQVIPTASGGLGAEITVNKEPAANGRITVVKLGDRGTDTKIEIVVISPDDSTSMTYTVTVSRALSNDATLSNLVVSQGVLVPSFNSAVMEYMVSVENDVETITVTPTANEYDTSIMVNSDAVASGTTSNEIALAEGGDTTITVKATAAYGNMESYIIVVSRAPSSDATLSSLIVSAGELEPSPFNPTTTSYTISVENAIATMTVNATATNENAAIMVNDEAVASGTTSNEIALTEGGITTIEIEVTAQDGATTETYTVVVNRAPSSDASLSNLTVSAGELEPSPFNPTTTSYTISVENAVATMTVIPVATNNNAAIMVNGETVDSGTTSNEIALTEGGTTTIEIKVTAQNGVAMESYTILVSRPPSNDATLSGLSLTDGDDKPVLLNENFRSDLTTYTVNVVDTIGIIKVMPISHDEATIRVIADETTVIVASGGSTDVSLESVGMETEIVIVVTAQDGETRQTYTITVSRASVPQPDDATLFNLLLRDDDTNIISLNKSFDSNETTYTADVAHTIGTVEVIPTAGGGSGAKITVNDSTVVSGESTSITLADPGTPTTIEIAVTSQDETATMTYTVTVNRALSNDATLSALVLSEGELDPDFDSGVVEYAVSVENSVAAITVTPTANDPNVISIMVNGATVISDAASDEISLTEGDSNTITIVVTAQDGDTMQTYIVVVNRALSSDATLSNLAVSEGELVPSPFNPTTKNYTISVSNEVATITVTPTVTDDNASITVNGDAVDSGTISNEIALTEGGITTITVVTTAADGDTMETYTIVVSRAPSSDATLSNLTVSVGGLMPAFNSETTTYTVAVDDDVTMVTMTPTATNSNATITVNDTAVVSGQSTDVALGEPGTATNIAIVVTAQDGTTETYTVVVTQSPAGLRVRVKVFLEGPLR